MTKMEDYDKIQFWQLGLADMSVKSFCTVKWDSTIYYDDCDKLTNKLITLRPFK